MAFYKTPLLIGFLRPDIIFLIGVLQALFPYIIWFSFGANENYNQNINGDGALLWVIGFFAFYLGSKFCPNSELEKLNCNKTSLLRSRHVLCCFLIFWFLVFVAVTYAYGGIPILSLLEGSIQIDSVNDIQAYGPPGLFGLWLVANTALIIATSIYTIARIESKNTLTPMLFFGLVAIFFGAIYAGKRQGLLIAATILAPSILIGFSRVLSGKKWRSFIKRGMWCFLLVAFVLAALFGAIGKIRTADQVNGNSLFQMYSYLEFPLINLEWQIEEFGIIYGQGNSFPLLSGFVPYKLISGEAHGVDNTFAIYGFLYPEPGIGAGYFGPVHLALGLFGVVFFGLITGYLTTIIYYRALCRTSWIVPYSIIVWPLVSAHSYSHFTSIIFFILPFLLSIILSKYVFEDSII